MPLSNSNVNNLHFLFDVRLQGSLILFYTFHIITLDQHKKNY